MLFVFRGPGMPRLLLRGQECGISKAGELSVLSEAAGAFVHVDLKANLLSDWQEVSVKRLSF